MTLDVDYLVIGAGAAGIAAGRRLREAGANFLVLEARDRIGGRAYTLLTPHVMDLGCGWLHSADRNAWRALAESEGWAIDRSPPPWARPSSDPKATKAEAERFSEAMADFEMAVEACANADADRPVSDFLPDEPRHRVMIEAVGAYITGAALSDVSAKDYARYEDSDVNWRIEDGYGALIAWMGRDLPVRLSSPVSVLRHGPQGVEAQTPAGPVRARAAIVCVPTTILANESLRLDPPLPHKLEATRGLPLGCAEKAYFLLQNPDLVPVEGYALGRTDTCETGSYILRPLGRPVVECFFAGALARRFARGEDMMAFARRELKDLFGQAFEESLRPVANSAWGRDPFALGAYSFAKPGCADMRGVLAAPEAGRLFFGGEACSPNFFSTAHGAYESGRRAAKEALAG